MAVYVAYSDEAAVGGNVDDEFVVAGYVADEQEWPSFAKAWQERVLDGPPKIPCFHMTEMRSREWRKKYGLSRDAADRRIKEALRVIHSSGFVLPASSTINQSQLREIIQKKFIDSAKHVPAGIDEPDYLCYTAFFHMVLNDASSRFPDVEKVNFYFAQKKDRITLNLRAIANHARSFLNAVHPEIAHLMGEAMPGDPNLFLPLQAADLVCWHLQRYHAEHRGQVIFEPDFIDHLLVSLKGRKEALQEWTPEMLEELAAAVDRIDWDDDESTSHGGSGISPSRPNGGNRPPIAFRAA